MPASSTILIPCNGPGTNPSSHGAATPTNDRGIAPAYGRGVTETEPGLASSPGRVTLLGEHTDYNGGCALGVATEQRTTVHATTARHGVLEVTSSALGSASTTLARPTGPPHLLLAASLARAAGVTAARLEVRSELPIGAGLSSSAAYAVATALALGMTGDPVTLARACQAAERAAGSDVGLLDQMVVLVARRGEIVDLDFIGPTATSMALPSSIGLSVVDSGERRTVAASAYKARREECKAAARVLGPLGRATRGQLTALDDPQLRRRARHVVAECERVDRARRALAAGDLVSFGVLVDEGHASLRDDFEASTPRVEAIRDVLRALPGVVGVRLTGAGFGGALLVVHEPDAAVALDGHWSSRLVPSDGASVSSTPTPR
jgi:galactokinase